MDKLDKLFDDLEFQLNDESMKYRRLKICIYSFEISRVVIYFKFSYRIILFKYICYFKCNFNSYYR